MLGAVLLVGMKLAAVLVPVVVVFWLPKSGLILVPAMAADALMSALTRVPSAIIVLVTVPVSAAVIAVPLILVLSIAAVALISASTMVPSAIIVLVIVPAGTLLRFSLARGVPPAVALS